NSTLREAQPSWRGAQVPEAKPPQQASLGARLHTTGQRGAPVQDFTNFIPSASFKLQNGLLVNNKQFQA
ncbi:hypothetical protein A2U01_0088993, partial [Trifolium medium]|nr:hypothetical protein [Trifolium medium]